jgi:hypothetical protein
MLLPLACPVLQIGTFMQQGICFGSWEGHTSSCASLHLCGHRSFVPSLAAPWRTLCCYAELPSSPASASRTSHWWDRSAKSGLGNTLLSQPAFTMTNILACLVSQLCYETPCVSVNVDTSVCTSGQSTHDAPPPFERCESSPSHTTTLIAHATVSPHGRLRLVPVIKLASDARLERLKANRFSSVHSTDRLETSHHF